MKHQEKNRRKTKALSAEARLRHVRAWRRSGLSASAYAHKHNLKAKNLYVWRSKLKINSETWRVQKAVRAKSSSTILPVCVEGVILRVKMSPLFAGQNASFLRMSI